ncbi:MAG: hypothetical protein ACP5UA_01720, partial [Candidatus Hydrogenedens sp.]
MQKKNLLALVLVTQIILLLSGCTPKIGVSPTSIDFGKDLDQAKIKVWNDKFIILKKLVFKVESNVNWVVGIMPTQDVSKKRKDVKEVTILVSREGLPAGEHTGKIIVSQVDPKTGKKVVPPVEIPIKITAEGGEGTPEGTPEGENPTPSIVSVLESLGFGGGGSNFTYNDVADNLQQIKAKIQEILGFTINIELLRECSNTISENYFIRQVPV